MVARPFLAQRLLAAGEWGWVMRRLVAENQVVLGLVPAPWWEKLGPQVPGCGSEDLRARIGLLVGKARAEGTPGTGVDLLVGEAMSWASAGPLVGGARS